jgi:hypothetical protein
MRISVQRKVREVAQSRAATVIINLATRRIPVSPLACGGALRVEPKRRRQSLPIAFGANRLRRLH